MFEKMRERWKEWCIKPDYAAITKELFGDAVSHRLIEDVETAKEYPLLAVQDKYVYCENVYSGEYKGIKFEYMDYACLYDKPHLIREHRWYYQVDYLVIHNIITRQKISVGWKYENYKKKGWIKNEKIEGEKVWSEEFPITESEREKIRYYKKWVSKNFLECLYVLYFDKTDLYIIFYQDHPGTESTCVRQDITLVKKALDNLNMC